MADVGGPLGPAVALTAGVVSFFSPCVLPLVPAYVARMAGVSSPGEAVSRRRTALHAASFVLGLSTVFVAMGASVGVVGYALLDRLPLLLRLAGLLVIVFGLHMTGIIRIPLLYRTAQVNFPGGTKRRSYLASGLVGGAFALGWTPCVGPVLGSTLALAATGGTVARGALLLTFYAVGLGVPFLIAGLAMGNVMRVAKRLGPHLILLERAGGAVLIVMGVLLFTDSLTRISQFTADLGIGGL